MPMALWSLRGSITKGRRFLRGALRRGDMSDALYALGRIAIVVFFLLAGVNMLSDVDGTTREISTQILVKLPADAVAAVPVSNLAQISALTAGVLAVICSVLIIFGY